jgi:hypothetical protein
MVLIGNLCITDEELSIARNGRSLLSGANDCARLPVLHLITQKNTHLAQLICTTGRSLSDELDPRLVITMTSRHYNTVITPDPSS